MLVMNTGLFSPCLFLQSEVESRVSFHFDASDRISAPDEHHLRPLLGYDWIAGIGLSLSLISVIDSQSSPSPKK